MRDAQRSIFRANAVQDYLGGRRAAVLPRFISPSHLAFLWVAFGLLAAIGGGSLYFVKIPIFATGSAIVSPRADGEGAARRDPQVVVLLPPEHLVSLRAGQETRLQSSSRNGEPGERLSASIVRVEPKVVDPDAARERFLPGAATGPLTGPVAVALARVEPWSDVPPASLREGTAYDADVEIESRRVVSLLPIVGRWFGGGR